MRLLRRPFFSGARDAKAFSVCQRVIHWTVSILCVAQVPTAWAIQRTHMAHGFLRPNPVDLLLHQVHAWNGWLIMLLALTQLVLRCTLGRPSLVEDAPQLERWAARAIHAGLYGLLCLLPITGTIAMYLSFKIAPLHSLLTWLLFGAALVHTAAALWHHFHRRNDVLLRMLRRTP